MTLVGPGDFESAVIVVPGPQPEEACCGESFGAIFRVLQIACDLRLYKSIERHVIVESLNNPVPIGIGVRIRTIAFWIRIQASVIVFTITGDIQPDTTPSFAIMR